MDHHPVTGLFPLLPADELADLAVDITEHGLLHPIVLDGEGRILDGRNRLAACERAKVEPAFVTYDGTDPDGYALAVNLQRRNLTKGQQAMVAARALLVSNTSAASASNSTGINRTRIAQAVTVRDHAPDLIDAVIAGAIGLDEAYRTARERKTAADSVEAQIARLRAEDPELADRVIEGELTLKGAWAERKERETQERRDVEAAHVEAGRIVATLRSSVATVVAGCRYGAKGLVTKSMVRELRNAIDLLEGEL